MTEVSALQHPLLNLNAPFPQLSVKTLGGGTTIVGENTDRWTMLVVYRGKHCPRCKKYLNKLNDMRQAWQNAGIDIICLSADPRKKAQADLDEFGWGFDLGYGLEVADMRRLGLYVSTPLSEAETDRPFAEPGTYCISPQGRVQIIAISNSPAARPDLDELLDGMKFNITNNRPARGLA